MRPPWGGLGLRDQNHWPPTARCSVGPFVRHCRAIRDRSIPPNHGSPEDDSLLQEGEIDPPRGRLPFDRAIAQSTRPVLTHLNRSQLADQPPPTNRGGWLRFAHLWQVLVPSLSSPSFPFSYPQFLWITQKPLALDSGFFVAAADGVRTIRLVRCLGIG